MSHKKEKVMKEEKQKRLDRNSPKPSSSIRGEFVTWIEKLDRNKPEMFEILSKEEGERIRQNREASRQEIIDRICDIMDLKQDGMYTEDMRNSLRDLRNKVWAHVEAVQDKEAPGGSHYEYFSEEHLNNDFKELYRCGECLKIGSENLRIQALLELFNLSTNLQRGVASTTFLKSLGEMPSDVFKWKNYFKQMGIVIE